MSDTGDELTRAAAIAARLGGLRSNPHLTDASTVPLLSPDECAEVLAQLDQGGDNGGDDNAWSAMEVLSSPADATGPVTQTSIVMPTVRRGRQRTVPGGNSGPLATRITDQVFDVNRRIYDFRLVGIEHPVQLLWYGAQSADGYVAHMDIGPVSSLRKLSFSLLLSDPDTFDGGDLSFSTPFPLARTQGTLTIFPSYLRHEVTPVTRGDRYVIVGFAVGPSFA
jgi:predicted 2-oxoglutarate/Fe(II)-dependent dioxygenase YbiX